MQRLLHIDASPRGPRSRSRNVTQAFLQNLQSHKPALQVSTLDLWHSKLPDLGEGMIEGRYDLIMGQDVPADVASAWKEISGYCERFLSYDAYLFSVPMWNFGIPYRLKHYIDIITQPRMLFTNDATGNVVGHAAGKKAIVIAASAMPIGIEGALREYDFQLAYLEKWLGFIGVTDISTLRAAPTFGDPVAVEAAMEKARTQAQLLAQGL